MLKVETLVNYKHPSGITFPLCYGYRVNGELEFIDNDRAFVQRVVFGINKSKKVW